MLYYTTYIEAVNKYGKVSSVLKNTSNSSLDIKDILETQFVQNFHVVVASDKTRKMIITAIKSGDNGETLSNRDVNFMVLDSTVDKISPASLSDECTLVLRVKDYRVTDSVMRFLKDFQLGEYMDSKFKRADTKTFYILATKDKSADENWTDIISDSIQERKSTIQKIEQGFPGDISSMLDEQIIATNEYLMNI